MRHMLVKIVAVVALAALAIMSIESTAFAGGTALAASAGANVDESASLQVGDTSNPFGDLRDSAAPIKSWSGPPAINLNKGPLFGPLSNEEEYEERRLEEEEEYEERRLEEEEEEQDKIGRPFKA